MLSDALYAISNPLLSGCDEGGVGYPMKRLMIGGHRRPVHRADRVQHHRRSRDYNDDEHNPRTRGPPIFGSR